MRINLSYLIKVFVFILALVLTGRLVYISFFPQNEQATSIITLDSSIKYQIITGWEAVAQAGQVEEPSAYNDAKDVLFYLAYEAGINRLRLEVHNGQENSLDYFTPYVTGQETRPWWKKQLYKPVNDNEDPFTINWSGFQFTGLEYSIEKVVMPLKSMLETNGEKLYINLLYVDFEPSIFEHCSNPEEYAEFILAVFQHMDSKYGFVPDAVEVILEPDHWDRTDCWKDPGFITKAILATGKRLETSGYRPDFIAPATVNMSNASKYFDEMIAESPHVLKYLSEISYHRYTGVSIRDLKKIAKRGKKYGIRTSMLEWWNKGNSYKTLHEDLKIGHNSSWQSNVLAAPIVWDPDFSFVVTDDRDPSNMNIYVPAKTKYARQYFKFIRAGAQRIEATSSNSVFDPLAFINANGGYVVVVKAAAGGDFSIDGLPKGTYGIKYTTGDGHSLPTSYDIDVQNVTINTDQSLNTNIPAAGVITIYFK